LWPRRSVATGPSSRTASMPACSSLIYNPGWHRGARLEKDAAVAAPHPPPLPAHCCPSYSADRSEALWSGSPLLRRGHGTVEASIPFGRVYSSSSGGESQSSLLLYMILQFRWTPFRILHFHHLLTGTWAFDVYLKYFEILIGLGSLFHHTSIWIKQILKRPSRLATIGWLFNQIGKANQK
jgi:hypothetical protein